MEEGGVPFLGRTEELDLLENLLTGLREGSRSNLCLAGIPGSGKSTILKRYLEDRGEEWSEEGIILAYLPFGAWGESAVEWGQNFVAHIAASFVAAVGGGVEPRRLLAQDTFPDEARRLHSEALETFTEALERFMHTEGEGDEEILEAALKFPEVFASEKNLRFVLFLDDFHLLHGHRLGPDASAVDRFAEALEGQEEVFYVVTLSPSPFADRYFLADEAVFHNSFQYYSIEALPESHAEALAAKALQGDGEGAKRLARLSAGQPLPLLALARAVKRGRGGAKPTASEVDRAFTAQVLVPWGAVYRHFEGLLLRTLASEADLGPAREILFTLASGQRVPREELANVSGRSGKALGSLLGRILSLGLFRRVESSFYFEDALFRFWAVRAAGRKGGPPDRFTGEESKALAEEFLKDFLPVKKETSIASKKFNFRALVAIVKGKELPGKWLGSAGTVRFPLFEKVQGFAFSSKEIKVYYLAGKGAGWFLLVMWKNVVVPPRVLKAFARRARGRAHGLWLVGRAGFSEEALAFARERGIYCSSESDLENLMEAANEP
ncbi:MAG: AAA family ATPase [Planctomycetota bacterium]|jgi:hypothetical protein